MAGICMLILHDNYKVIIMKLNSITIEQLLADIDITNNGYIYRPNFMQIECAKLYSHLVENNGGCLTRIGTHIERQCVDVYSGETVNHYYDNNEYEGAVLARQESLS